MARLSFRTQPLMALEKSICSVHSGEGDSFGGKERAESKREWASDD